MGGLLLFVVLYMIFYCNQKTFHIKDKVAVITGAASGIGKLLAIKLAHEGAQVVLIDVDMDGLKKTLAIIESQEMYVAKKQAHIMQCDVSDFE